LSGVVRKVARDEVASSADERPADIDVPARGVVVVALSVAILVAWYQGFRLPKSWCATLSAVSVTDGFHRRFVVGTLLRPLANATDYSYWVFAAYGMLILAALLAVLHIQALRTRLLGQRLLLVAFFLLPTGGFLFHEVGYFEQTIYLLGFGAIALLRRGRIVAATCVISIAPFVHEISILTIIPIFGLVALRRLPLPQAAVVTAIPAVLNVFVLSIAPASDGAIETLAASLQLADWPYRPDALELFARSQHDNWGLYKIHAVVVLVKPVAIGAIVAFACLWWSDRELRTAGKEVPSLAMFVASCAAVALPGLLVYGGWDANRWMFLLVVNFFIVAWMTLGEREREPSGRSITVLVTVVLLCSQIHFTYFPPDQPRELTSRHLGTFLRQLGTGKLFVPPSL
jgi:hypothetical protein